MCIERVGPGVVMWVVIAVVSVSAHAQEEGEDSEEEEVEIVTTTARAPMPAFMADRSVAVATEDEIYERQASSITDAIEEETGVTRQSTNRGADTVYLRGLVGPENLIYVDGVRFNQSIFRTGPNQYLNTLDPWAMDRVEVVRGPGSVLYGSGAMGGVIQLFPRRIPPEPFHIRGMGTYQTADSTLGSGLDLGFRAGSFGLSLGTSVRDHGQLRIGSRGGEGIFSSAEEGGRILASDYQEVFWRGQTAVEITSRSSFRLNYMSGLIGGAKRTDQLGIGDMRITDNHDDLLWATYVYEGRGTLEEIRVNTSFHRTREIADRYRCRTQPGGPQNEFFIVEDLPACAALQPDAVVSQTRNDDVATTLGTSLVGVNAFYPLGVRLSWGGELYSDRILSTREIATFPDFEATRASRGNFSSGSTFTSMGGFFSGDYSLFSDVAQEVILKGGARVENFRAFAPEVTPEIGDVEFSRTGVVGSLGASYLWRTHLNLYLNWSQGFRAPNLQETTVLGDTGNFFEIPNTDLGPERNNTFELGSKVEVPGIARLQASTFVSLISDRITRTDATFEGEEEVGGKPVQQRINAERAYYYGAEAGLATVSILGLSLFGDIAYIDGAVESGRDDEFFEPRFLHSLLGSDAQYSYPRRLPPLKYRAGVRFAPDTRWHSAVFLEGASSQERLAPGDVRDLRICEVDRGLTYGDLGEKCPGTPGWTTLNVRGGYRIADSSRLDLSLMNLTDQRYRHHGSGVLAPGFNAMITLVVTQ
ncbi:MAG: TonB-dependent receptor [Bradymonadaceae bacterium]